MLVCAHHCFLAVAFGLNCLGFCAFERGSLKPRRGRLADNAINGIPACGNEWLLQKVARDAWNRSDVIIQSDCGAVSNIYHQHHAVQVPLLSAFRAMHSPK